MDVVSIGRRRTFSERLAGRAKSSQLVNDQRGGSWSSQACGSLGKRPRKKKKKGWRSQNKLMRWIRAGLNFRKSLSACLEGGGRYLVQDLLLVQRPSLYWRCSYPWAWLLFLEDGFRPSYTENTRHASWVGADFQTVGPQNLASKLNGTLNHPLGTQQTTSRRLDGVFAGTVSPVKFQQGTAREE